MLLAELPDVVDRQDVRMIQRRRRARLVLQPLAQILVRPHRRRQDLQRHRPLQLRIVREIHLTHPPRSDERADLVTAEMGTGWRAWVVEIVVSNVLVLESSVSLSECRTWWAFRLGFTIRDTETQSAVLDADRKFWLTDRSFSRLNR